MKTRLISILATLGLVSLVASALDVAQGRVPLPLARVARAAGCPPDVVFGCLLTGSGAHGWRVNNSTAAVGAAGIVGQITSTAPGSRSSGVRGINNATSVQGYGVYGSHAGGGHGVLGTTISGMGVYGSATGGTGVYGRHTNTTGSDPGVQGETSSTAAYAAGVLGKATATGTNSGSAGVWGFNASTSNTGSGVFGQHAGKGWAVAARNGLGNVGGLATDLYGAYGTNNLLSEGALASGNRGVYGKSTQGDGVVGISSAAHGYGVLAIGDGGALDRAALNAVSAESNSGWAGFFQGKIYVTHGVSSAAEQSLLMDHPLDPANQYLSHAAVESPEMMNVYNGNITLDNQGQAWVALPSYFEALNRDFRYQLTAIGAPGPNLYIAEQVTGNRFKIAGGTPGMQVSWQVTGLRNDPYARQHPLQVEAAKPVTERGRYLHPESYGQPETLGIGYEAHREAEELLPAIPEATP